MQKIDYYNIRLNNNNTEEALANCKVFFKSNKNHLIFFINAHCFNIAQKESHYRKALNEAELLLNDGIGIKLGALFSGILLKENMNGTDFIPRLISLARDQKMKVYLLGGEDGIAKNAKVKLEQKIKGVSIVGYQNGYFNFDEDQEIVSDIINHNTDLLIVGMGVPRQELWLTKNKEKLHGVKLCVAGGAVLDFISEKVKRAPLWMQKTGTEWIYRLLHEPFRLFNRYFIGIPLFFFNLLKTK